MSNIRDLQQAAQLLEDYGRPALARLVRNGVTETEQAHWQAKLDKVDECLDRLNETPDSPVVESIYNRRPDTNLPESIVTLTTELSAAGLIPIVIDEDFDFTTLPDLR